MPSRPQTSRRARRGIHNASTVPREDLRGPWVRLRSATHHPFIFDRMVGEVDPSAQPGDVVTVYDKRGTFFARGLYNPHSKIAVRVLTYADEDVDDAFWRRRIEDAVALRNRLGIPARSDAYRLIHSEGDGLSGLVLERYGDTLVAEVFSRGILERIDDLLTIAVQTLDAYPPGAAAPTHKQAGSQAGWRRVVRADPDIARLEGFAVPEPRGAPGEIIVTEHGIRYAVDVVGGHKTGFFCDQRENRSQFAHWCHDARVLDVFCYSGGFGLAAKLLGGASEVVGVDLDEAALALARRNANLNQTRIKHAHSDAFVYLRQMLDARRSFDAVVVDPPKFCPSRRGLDAGLRKYFDLNRLAAQCVAPGGLLLTCSCSGLVSPERFRGLVESAVRQTGRTLQILDQRGAAPDHPVAANCPETAYLKALYLRLL